MSLRVYNSIGELFKEVIKIHGKRSFLEWRGAVGEKYQLTYREVYERSAAIAAGLHAVCAIEKGDHVSLCSETRQEWVVTDLGVLGMGGVIVTLYPSLTAKQMHYIMKDSESKILIVDECENLEKMLSVWATLPNISHVFFFDDLSEKDLVDIDAPLDKVKSLQWLIEQGREYLKDHPDFFESAIAKVQENDLASIIYTSGTTGVPKGVMLSHRNFLSNAITCSEIIKTVDEKIKPYEQNSLTFMPLSHSYARSAEEFLALYNGGRICIAGGRSPAIIETGFKVFKPTLMAGIPYVYEKVYNTIFRKVKEKYPPKMQGLFMKALAFGKKYNKIVASGEKPTLKQRIHHWIDEKLIYKKVREELGGRLLAFISGSARLDPEIIETFWALGIHILDGFGLTESTPVTHYQRTWENSTYRPNWPKDKHIHPLAKIGSVGPPIEFPGNPYPNVEAKIAEDGELLIRGPNVMQGYWKKPEETEAVLDPDGWLHTGDLGRIDEDGYLFITGRKKVIIKLSTGKMISPAYVEDKLVLSPFLLQVVLVGSDQKYLTAFVVPDQKGVKEFAEAQKISYKTYQDLLQDERVLAEIKKEILTRSKDLAAYETIKKFAVFAQEFNEEDGYLTPTLKFKRAKVLRDFQDVIEKIYATEQDWVIVEDRLVDFHELTIPG